MTAAYIPPDVYAKLAMEELYAGIITQQSAHPEGAFNHSNMRTILPKFQQNVTRSTRGNNILEHVYRKQNYIWNRNKNTFIVLFSVAVCSKVFIVKRLIMYKIAFFGDVYFQIPGSVRSILMESLLRYHAWLLRHGRCEMNSGSETPEKFYF